jgi:arsenite methyltransferase
VSEPMQFDEAASRALVASYKTDDVVEQRRAFLRALELRPGERVLDIGSGPGFLAAEMADVVGPGLVHGVDPSQSMLEIARRHTQAAEFHEGTATELEFGDASFEVAVSTQVYEYVKDIAAALAEARRVLVPGGRLLVLDTDWDSIVFRSSDDERMARVLRAWDEHLVHPHLPRYLPQLLAEAGFGLERCEVFPMLNVGYERDTYAGNGLELIARFVPGHGGVTAEEAEAWAADLRGLGSRFFFSVNRYVFRARSLDRLSNLG